MNKHTPGPWEYAGPHKTNKANNFGTPNGWTFVKHNFPDYPYEGDLENEYGIYPPLGEAGPIALVSGEADARLIAASPEMYEYIKEKSEEGCEQAKKFMRLLS